MHHMVETLIALQSFVFLQAEEASLVTIAEKKEGRQGGKQSSLNCHVGWYLSLIMRKAGKQIGNYFFQCVEQAFMPPALSM